MVQIARKFLNLMRGKFSMTLPNQLVNTQPFINMIEQYKKTMKLSGHYLMRVQKYCLENQIHPKNYQEYMMVTTQLPITDEELQAVTLLSQFVAMKPLEEAKA